MEREDIEVEAKRGDKHPGVEGAAGRRNARAAERETGERHSLAKAAGEAWDAWVAAGARPGMSRKHEEHDVPGWRMWREHITLVDPETLEQLAALERRSHTVKGDELRVHEAYVRHGASGEEELLRMGDEVLRATHLALAYRAMERLAPDDQQKLARWLDTGKGGEPRAILRNLAGKVADTQRAKDEPGHKACPVGQRVVKIHRAGRKLRADRLRPPEAA